MKCKNEFYVELEQIATWWIEHSIDDVNGGFYGEVSNRCVPTQNADKGLVLNARILWFFSESAKMLGDETYRLAADRAFEYLRANFRDEQHGGYWWLVDHLGQAVSRRKQVYGQSFVIYAYCAYYSLTGNKLALEDSKAIFNLLEKYAVDDTYGGYLEAFSDSWSPIDDLRLSEKDLNHPKTMNTHLHVLEAYTSLFMVQPSKEHDAALRRILGYFKNHIVNGDVNHLRMFLDSEWGDHSTAYSYGHDIEASWLVWKALDALDDQSLTDEFKSLVLGLAESCHQHAVADTGGIFDEFDIIENKKKHEFPWWVQAEALVGFYNAYQITGKRAYLDVFEGVWLFINEYVKDTEYGEWRWFSTVCQNEKGNEETPYKATTYKAGCWKGPYHNGRAMIEICKRSAEKAFSKLEKSA